MLEKPLFVNESEDGSESLKWNPVAPNRGNALMHMNRKERTAIGRNKRKRRRHTASLLAICLLLTAATACSKETIQPTTPPVSPTASVSPAPTAVQTPLPTPEAFAMPLTGLPVDAPI